MRLGHKRIEFSPSCSYEGGLRPALLQDLEIEMKFQVLGHLLPAMVNDDYTGITPSDGLALRKFYEVLNADDWLISVVSSERSFCKCEVTGLAGDCFEVEIKNV